MTRKSFCQQLTDVCIPNLYEQNPFCLLQLLAFSSERTLRRRREELDAASQLGEKAWEAEFEGCLNYDNSCSPQYDSLKVVFERLDNPLQRIIDELFWFWPLGTFSEVPPGTTSASDIENLLARCILESPDKTPRDTAISKHNLAISAHFRAIVAEQQLFANEEMDEAGSDSIEAVDKLWEKTFLLWEEVVGDNEIWKILQERADAIGDQRLPADFIARLRNELPRALKQINIHFAVRCIGNLLTRTPEKDEGLHDFRADLVRHLNYISTYFPTAEDEETRQNAIVDEMSRQFENLIHYWTTNIATTRPRYVIGKGHSFLSKTQGYRRYIEDYLGKGHPVYDRICNKIAELCNRCVVVGGNEPQEWEDAISLLRKSIPIVQSPSLKTAMMDNLRDLQDKLQNWKNHTPCWFCQDQQAELGYMLEYKMHGNLQTETKFLSSQYQTKWSTFSVKVPRCRNCARREINQERLNQYPPIAQKLQEGFQQGEKPSEEECNLHYMMTQKALLWKESESWGK